MKKVIAAVVGAAFAAASFGSFAASTSAVQPAKTQQVAVHKAKAKHGALHHVKAKKKVVRHGKKAQHNA